MGLREPPGAVVPALWITFALNNNHTLKPIKGKGSFSLYDNPWQ